MFARGAIAGDITGTTGDSVQVSLAVKPRQAQAIEPGAARLARQMNGLPGLDKI